MLLARKARVIIIPTFITTPHHCPRGIAPNAAPRAAPINQDVKEPRADLTNPLANAEASAIRPFPTKYIPLAR